MARTNEALEELLPHRLVERAGLRRGEPCELRLACLGGHLLGAGLTSTKHAVCVLQAGAPEAKRHRDAEELRRLGRDERIPCLVARAAGRPAPVLEVGAPLVPEHAHERQDEVGLTEVLPLGVDADEHVRHLLFGDVLAEHQRGELVSVDCRKAIQSIGNAFTIPVLKRPRCFQPLHELADDGVRRSRPDRADVVKIGRIAVRDRGRYIERPVLWAKRDPDPPLLEILSQHWATLHHRKQRRESLLPVDDQGLGGQLLTIGPDLFRPRLSTAIPEEQVSHRVAAIHRIEKITDLRRLPYERALDVGQSDRSNSDRVHQRPKRELDLREDCFRHCHPLIGRPSDQHRDRPRGLKPNQRVGPQSGERVDEGQT